jgi:OOP family OmpA-OmpF porin
MKTYLSILVLLTAFTLSSQTVRYNTLSLEGGVGIHAPLAPGDQIGRSNYVGIGHVQVGMRYMFSQPFGVRAKYSYEGFRDSRNSQGIDMHSFSADLVFNLGRAINLNLHPRMYETIGLLGHAGAGLTIGAPTQGNIFEKIGSFNFGLRPMVRMNDQLAIYGDFTYTMTIKQHYLYNGNLYSSDYQALNGAFASLSIGFIINLGQYQKHIDWW